MCRETSCDNQWCLCSLWPPAVHKSSYKSTPSPDNWCVLNGMLLLTIADASRHGVGLWTSSTNGVEAQGHAPYLSCGKRMPSMFVFCPHATGSSKVPLGKREPPSRWFSRLYSPCSLNRSLCYFLFSRSLFLAAFPSSVGSFPDPPSQLGGS